MMIQELIAQSLALIRDALGRAEKPVIAWSSGKDSQVMLYLIRQVRRDIPVLHLRGFADERKHDFAEDEIGRMGLLMIEPQPVAREAVAIGDHVELVEAYMLNDRAALYYPMEPEPGHVPGPGSYCAIEKLNQPVQPQDIAALRVDCIFIGHRSDDVDRLLGAIPLAEDTAEGCGVLFVYPLRNWTEANIWEASELLNVPQNKARYERKDPDANPDHWPLCVECLKPTDRESVICPKIGEPVFAIGKHLNLERRREEWRDKFVNIRRIENGHQA